MAGRIGRTLGGIGLAALLAYGLFFAVQTLRPRALALELPSGLEAGDVVLMRSHTWRAELVRLIDGVPYRDGFSHVGLLHSRGADGVWTLVHAVPGADGTVRAERWPDIARGGGISEAVVFRNTALDADARADLVVLQAEAAARAVPFDGGFDHHDASELYCTELVTHLHGLVGAPAVGPKVMARRAIFPGHLAASPALVPVGTTADAPR